MEFLINESHIILIVIPQLNIFSFCYERYIVCQKKTRELLKSDDKGVWIQIEERKPLLVSLDQVFATKCGRGVFLFLSWSQS